MYSAKKQKMNGLRENENDWWIMNSLSKSVAGHDNAVHGQSGVWVQLWQTILRHENLAKARKTKSPHPSQVGLKPSVDRGSREGHYEHDKVDDVEGASPRAHVSQRRQIHPGKLFCCAGKFRLRHRRIQMNNTYRWTWILSELLGYPEP